MLVRFGFEAADNAAAPNRRSLNSEQRPRAEAQGRLRVRRLIGR